MRRYVRSISMPLALGLCVACATARGQAVPTPRSSDRPPDPPTLELPADEGPVPRISLDPGPLGGEGATSADSFVESAEEPPPDAFDVSPDYARPQRLRNYLRNRPRQLPLERESWLNRPYSAGFFFGGLSLDDPLDGLLSGDAGLVYGGRFGWDFGPRWGVETRLGGASAGLQAVGIAVDIPQADAFFWDLNWLWYPTGDTRWRPYFLLGTGLFDLDYRDPANRRFHNTTLELPFGAGFKYRYSTRIAMRFEVLDNFSFGSGIQSPMNNLSVTAGFEYRFGGGTRRSYWPWNPSRSWW